MTAPMTPAEFTNGVAWVMMQLLGEGKTTDELQELLEESCRLMFAAADGDEKAGALVAVAGQNYRETIAMAAEAMARTARERAH